MPQTVPKSPTKGADEATVARGRSGRIRSRLRSPRRWPAQARVNSCRGAAVDEGVSAAAVLQPMAVKP